MKIVRAHNIRLRPNNRQASHLRKACDVARFCYNWGLAEWKRQYEAGERPSGYSLRRKFNSIKRQEFLFVLDVTKCAADQPFVNLGRAFRNFFRNVKAGKPPGYPRFKRRDTRGSFYVSNDRIRFSGCRVNIPKLGWVRTQEPLRYEGKVFFAVITHTGNRWFCSVQVEIEIPDVVPKGPTIGVDVGIKELAVTSDGRAFSNARALRTAEPRLRLLQKAVSRKKKGSNNRRKAITKLQRQHYRVACIRSNTIHKATAAITKGCSRIVIENLNIKGMLRNHKLAKALSDASLSEFHRQLRYKAEQSGVEIITADRFYPSSKTCSDCGAIKDVLTLKERIYKCQQCGIEIDRDLNAAINLRNLAAGSAA